MPAMIGQATASFKPVPRRWLQRAWGTPYIFVRQDWMALWPQLMRLPESGVRVLDAGCGEGNWTLELGTRRPGWSLVGLDRKEECVLAAETARRRLGLSNVSFVRSDFMDFVAETKYDVVLSVFSAHYLIEDGKGTELFGRFRMWLKPGGCLLLLGPRLEKEIPFVPRLPRPGVRPGFSFEELSLLCRANGLTVEILRGEVGMFGTLARQLYYVGSGPFPHLLLRLGLYPLQWAFSFLDARLTFEKERRAFTWLLVARAPG